MVDDGLSRLDFGRAAEVSRSLGTLTTGSSALDRILGGGFQEGKLSEVFGPSNSGKTQLAMQAAVMAAGRGWSSLYVDTESTFRPERVQEIAQSRGIDPSLALNLVYWVRAKDVQAQVEVLASMREDRRVKASKLVVVDTLTKNFSLEFPGRERTGRRQGALGAYLQGMALDAYLRRRVVLLTNRVASIPGDGRSQVVDLGGLTLRKFVSRSLRLTREGGRIEARVEYPATPVSTARCVLSARGLD